MFELYIPIYMNTLICIFIRIVVYLGDLNGVFKRGFFQIVDKGVHETNELSYWE